MTPIRDPQGGMPPQGGKGQPQVKPGVPMPPQGAKGQPQTTLNLNSGQQVPVQGGKGLSRTLPPPGQGSTMPAQGGKGQNFGPNVFPAPQAQQPQTTLNLNSGQQVPVQGKGQPGQVPAQGGKAPLTQEQIAALGPVINNRLPPQPQVFPAQPQVLPALSRPQVLPQKPMPANMAPQGLMGLQNMLYGKQ